MLLAVFSSDGPVKFVIKFFIVYFIVKLWSLHCSLCKYVFPKLYFRLYIKRELKCVQQFSETKKITATQRLKKIELEYLEDMNYKIHGPCKDLRIF